MKKWPNSEKCQPEGKKIRGFKESILPKRQKHIKAYHGVRNDCKYFQGMVRMRGSKLKKNKQPKKPPKPQNLFQYKRDNEKCRIFSHYCQG